MEAEYEEDVPDLACSSVAVSPIAGNTLRVRYDSVSLMSNCERGLVPQVLAMADS